MEEQQIDLILQGLKDLHGKLVKAENGEKDEIYKFED